MTNRADMTAVIEGLQKHHGLLAAYLEAADRLDWRALSKVIVGEMPKPIAVETPVLPQPLKVSISTFVLRRANLVRASE